MRIARGLQSFGRQLTSYSPHRVAPPRHITAAAPGTRLLFHTSGGFFGRYDILDEEQGEFGRRATGSYIVERDITTPPPPKNVFSPTQGPVNPAGILETTESFDDFLHSARSMADQKTKMSAQGKRPAGPAPRMGEKDKKKRKLTKREKNIEGGCTREDILELDITALVSKLALTDPNKEDQADQKDEREKGAAVPVLPEQESEIVVEVKALASSGEGLAVVQGSTSPQVYVVPLTVPGDVARVKVYRHMNTYTITDLISVITASTARDESNIKCRYFGRCGGCQLQMLPYDAQLAHKRDIVVKAFANFSNLKPEQLPEVGETIGSPLQFGYRTKLTPHFDQPRGPGTRPGKKNKIPFSSCPDIGFMEVGRRKVMDIEDCPIGTEALRKGMVAERERMQNEFQRYKCGSTILLRESTNRVWKKKDGSPNGTPPLGSENAVVVETDEYTDYKTHVTDHHADSIEYVGNHIFKNPAGSFFQNNNSILPLVTDYVRERIAGDKPIRFLVDAYCGSGLFTITLASLFTDGKSGLSSPPRPRSRSGSPSGRAPLFGSIGVDVSVHSINYAKENARLSHLPKDACEFIAADASNMFSRVRTYEPDATAVVIDPPRKGCDASFLRQLMEFGPRRIAYVSCNVHTQARDIGMLVRGAIDAFGNENDEDEVFRSGKKKALYEIESIRGFDFFPQTGHVEGVAILNRVDIEE